MFDWKLDRCRRQHGEKLKRFWVRFRVAPTLNERLDLLKQFAAVKVWREQGYRIVRLRSRAAAAERPLKGFCKCCDGEPARVWHHVIQVQHGGRNKKSNQIALCARCHAAIHPWLRQPLPGGDFRAFSQDQRPRLVKASTI